MFGKIYRKYFKKYKFLLECKESKSKHIKNMDRIEKMVDTPKGGINCTDFCDTCKKETEHIIRDIVLNKSYIL